MAFRFENLQVWQQALQLSNNIDLLTKEFPKTETYSLGSQLKRAADSVVLNIADGCTGQSGAEFKRFLNMSLRSAIEVVAALFIARSRNFIDQPTFRFHYDEYEVLSKKITSLRTSIGK